MYKLLLLAVTGLLCACGTGDPYRQDGSVIGISGSAPGNTTELASTAVIPSLALWGGDVQCGASQGCRLFAVEHSANQAVLYSLARPQPRLLDRKPVAYHPDGARWLDENLTVAAVEGTNSLDIFDTRSNRLELLHQIRFSFPPRNVYAWPAASGEWVFLALPYDGSTVAWAQWNPANGQSAKHETKWCDSPWFVAPMQSKSSNALPDRLAVACWVDQTVVEVDLRNPSSLSDIAQRKPAVMKKFTHRAMQVGAEPKGKVLFSTEDLGENGWSYNVSTAQWQPRWHGLPGALAVSPLDAQTVAWGWRDGTVRLVRYSQTGAVDAYRDYKTTGSPDHMIWQDIDNNGRIDLVLITGSNQPSKIIFDVELP